MSKWDIILVLFLWIVIIRGVKLLLLETLGLVLFFSKWKILRLLFFDIVICKGFFLFELILYIRVLVLIRILIIFELIFGRDIVVNRGVEFLRFLVFIWVFVFISSLDIIGFYFFVVMWRGVVLECFGVRLIS